MPLGMSQTLVICGTAISVGRMTCRQTKRPPMTRSEKWTVTVTVFMDAPVVSIDIAAMIDNGRIEIGTGTGTGIGNEIRKGMRIGIDTEKEEETKKEKEGYTITNAVLVMMNRAVII